MITILGAGLSGLAASFHLGHNKCIIFEKNDYAGGHIYSEVINGFTWDEGPHVSFTRNKYVQSLFSNNVEQNFLEYPVKTANYYKGNWIPHPAQSNLFAVPQPLRDKCLQDFIEARKIDRSQYSPTNYKDWLIAAFGRTFYEHFPRAYTSKYWTIDPSFLTTDWVGERVFFPSIEEVKSGYLAPLNHETHYIKQVRYPLRGGYLSYAQPFIRDANIKFNHRVRFIRFKEKELFFDNGEKHYYDRLINTMPLPELIMMSDAPNEIKDAACMLACSSVLLINISVKHPAQKGYNWMYVYDEDKLCTRINYTELLSPYNAPLNCSGIQVEVYFSKFREKKLTNKEIADQVVKELIEMGLIIDISFVISSEVKWVQWGNIIFDHYRKESLDIVLNYLEQFGYKRNDQDLLPTTDWSSYKHSDESEILLVGRFAEWKYYWTDDCILKTYISEK